MKIQYIYLDGYKNLNKIEIFMPDNSSIVGIIGNNGSGKSNILEALTQIFTAVYNNEDIEFTYKINYSINDDQFEISNLDGVKFLKNGKSVGKTGRRVCLPRNIFLYYCGETDRLKQMALTCVDKAFETSLKDKGEIVIKYLSCVGLREFPAVLLANAVYKNNTFEKVCKLLGIEEARGPVEFHLSRPHWSKRAPINKDTFWNARGSVAILLHALKDCGQMTVMDSDHAIIQVDNISSIHLHAENPFDLFIRLKLLMQADILADIRFQLLKN